MTVRNYVNNAAVVQITGAITNVNTSVTISDASTYPTSFPYTAVIDGGLSTAEIVLVTAAAANVLTVTRGYDGTAAQSHASNASFQHVAVKADYVEANAHVNATTNIHGTGVSSAVVGTLTPQTLVSKTLTSPVITTPTVTGGTFSAPAVTGGATVAGTLAVTGGVTATTTVAATGAVTGASLTTTGDVTAGGKYQGQVARGLLAETTSNTAVALSGVVFHVQADTFCTFTLASTRRVRICGEVLIIPAAAAVGTYAATAAYQSGSSITVGGATTVGSTTTYVGGNPNQGSVKIERTVLLTAGTWTVAVFAARQSGGNASDAAAPFYTLATDIGNS